MAKHIQSNNPEQELKALRKENQELRQRLEQAEADVRLKDVYERLLSAAGDNISYVDREYTYRIMNTAYELSYNRPRKELEGRTVAEVMGEEEFRRHVKPRLDRALAGEEVRYTARFNQPGLGQVDREVVYRPDLDDSGKVAGVIVSARDVTRDRLVLEALHDSKERLRAIFHGAYDTIFLLDAKGRILDANERVADMFGVPPEKALGMSFGKDFTAPGESREELARILASAARGEEQFFSWQGKRPGDGNNLHMEVFIRRLVSSGDAVLLANVRDVTDRIQSEEALKQSEFKFRTVADFTYDWEFWLKPDWNFEYISPACKNITGYSSEEFLAEKNLFIQCIHPNDLGRTMAELERALSNPRSDFFDFRIRRKDGAERWVAMAIKPVFDHKTFLGVRGSIRDITHRVRAEEELRESEKKFRVLYEQATAGILLVDCEGIILEANPMFLDMLGYSPGDLEDTDYTLLIHPRDKETVPPQLPVILAGEAVRIERRLRMKNGKYIPMDMSAKRIGQDYVYFMVRDITQRKRYEEELQRAKRMAEDASRTKDQFLANISHEIRTPLSGILGLTEMVLGTSLSQDQKQYLEMVMSAARSLLVIINDILDLSKVEAGILELYNQDFNLREAVQTVVDAHKVEAAQKNLEIFLDVDRDVPEQVNGDPGRLAQVLRNLLSNAVKFTETGHIRVKVKSMAGAAGNHDLRFSVMDTGIGIRDDVVPKLFQSFIQADGSVSKKYGGTGLGLAISRELVEMMGGTIWAQSQERVGSTFSFSLPLREPSEVPESAPPDEARETAAPDQVLSVLLVEDNLINQTFLKHFLTESGHRVRAVNNGRLALEACAEERFDIILMDVQMPEMDGLETTRHIRGEIRDGRELAVPRNVPIIALTAYAMSRDQERFLDAGMDDFVAKPVIMDELLEKMLALCQGRAKAPIRPQNRPGELDDVQGIRLRWRTFQKKPEVFETMIRYFLEDMPTQSARLKAAMASGDHEDAMNTAHIMVNSAVTIGAAQTAEQAKRLESALQDKNTKAARQHQAAMEQSLKQVYKHLTQLITPPQQQKAV